MVDKILTIENKKYLVALSCKYEGLDYYFLININDKKDYKYCYQKFGKLFEVFELEDVFKISSLFSKQLI